MLAGAAAAILVAMALMLVRALRGPSHYDRMLAANAFGTKTVLLVGVIGAVMGRQDFLDIAIAYALINFLATIAILKLFAWHSLQVSLTHRRAEARRDG